MQGQRCKLVMTIDLEDDRRQELRNHIEDPQPSHPIEVERRLNRRFPGNLQFRSDDTQIAPLLE